MTTVTEDEQSPVNSLVAHQCIPLETSAPIFLFYMCFAYLTITLSIKIIKHRQTINNALYRNEHVLNCDKISCRKIPLNFGLLFQNLIYIGNLSTLLQFLILNKAYYLEIKIGLINESHKIFSNLQPFWNNHRITIFEEEEKRGSLCIKHGTLSIVSHYITLHPGDYTITSHSISNGITSYHAIIPNCITSYPILFYCVLSYHITSNHNISNPPSLYIISKILEFHDTQSRIMCIIDPCCDVFTGIV